MKTFAQTCFAIALSTASTLALANSPANQSMTECEKAKAAKTTEIAQQTKYDDVVIQAIAKAMHDPKTKY